MTLNVGVANGVITPQHPIALAGFANRQGTSLGTADDLMVGALVLDASGVGADPIVIVTLDLLGLYGEALTSEIKHSITEHTGVTDDRTFLCCSHTHSAPVLDSAVHMTGSETAAAQEYRSQLPKTIATVVASALSSRRSAVASLGIGRERIGHNRHTNADEPIDDELLVLRLDEVDGQPLAALVSYACHPVANGDSFHRYSADYVAALRDAVSSHTGAPTLFLQGACGDIDPLTRSADGSAARELGERLARAAVEAWNAAEQIEPNPLTLTRADIALPGRIPDDMARARGIVSGSEPAALDFASRFNRFWMRAAVEADDRGQQPSVSAAVGVLRLGTFAVAFHQAELYCELGMQIKAVSPFVATAIAGYTDGMIWYVPSKAAFESPHAYGVTVSLVASGAGELLRDQIVGLLDEAAEEGEA